MADELYGRLIGRWPVGKLIDNGKSALVTETGDGRRREAALKIFDPEIVEAAVTGYNWTGLSGRDPSLARDIRISLGSSTEAGRPTSGISSL